MRALGVDAAILVNERNFEGFKASYARFDWVAAECRSFSGPKELAERLDGLDLVVATTNTSAHSIAEAIAIAKKPALRTGYYVQDYEPLFYEVGSEAWNIAVSSFSVLKNCTYFAKTRWLCEMVGALHQHPVAAVTPSIDFGLYHPARRRPRAGSAGGGTRMVCAMVRPSTPRRAPQRTMRVLARILDRHAGQVDPRVFGADARELAASDVPTYPGIEVMGVLPQAQVAALMQQSDFFLDLSDYQAFGRTAAEAMACGTIALAPSIGGAADFIEDGRNSFMVDTRDEGAAFAAVERMLSMSDEELRLMRLAAVEAVSGFTPVAAAISELRAFGYA
jgi:glycosyltransferase involved in cell wall biosynthesis